MQTISAHARSARQNALYTVRWLRGSKISFLLGFLACFFAVFLVAVLDTTLEKAPLAFLKLAEMNGGEVDIRLGASKSSRAFFVNGTRMAERVAAAPGGLSSARELQRRGAIRGALDARLVSAGACVAAGLDPGRLGERWWRYRGPANCETASSSLTNHCFYRACRASPLFAELFAVDTAAERAAGVGRVWGLQPLRRGEAYLQSRAAYELNVTAGDLVFVRIEANRLLRSAFVAAGLPEFTLGSWNAVHMLLRVAAVVLDLAGKTGRADSASPALVMELGSFLETVWLNAHPEATYPPSRLTALRGVDPRSIVTVVLANMRDRLSTYSSARGDYDVALSRVTPLVSDLLFAVGYDEVQAWTPVLDALYATRAFAMYFGLVVNLLFAVLVLVSVLLVHALLSAAVAARGRDLGILRMVGESRGQAAQSVLLQAAAYALPAWAVGLAAAQGACVPLMRQVSGFVGADLDPLLLARSVGAATAAAVLVPLSASLLPLREALGPSLTDALECRRAPAALAAVSIERGAVGAIFLTVLLCLIGGLVTLASNLELPLERAALAVLSLPEAPGLATFAAATLQRRGSLAALSAPAGDPRGFGPAGREALEALLGPGPRPGAPGDPAAAPAPAPAPDFEAHAWVTVPLRDAVGLLLGSGSGSSSSSNGAATDADSSSAASSSSSSLLGGGGAVPAGFSSATTGASALPGSSAAARGEGTAVSNIGRAFSDGVRVFGVSPSLMAATEYPSFLRALYEAGDGGGLSDALYSVEGSQGPLLGSRYETAVGASLRGAGFLLDTGVRGGAARGAAGGPAARMRPLALLDAAPGFKMSRTCSCRSPLSTGSSRCGRAAVEAGMGGLPPGLRSADQIPMGRLLLKVAAASPLRTSSAARSAMAARLERAARGASSWFYWDRVAGLSEAAGVMDLAFSGASVAAMAVCLVGAAAYI
eukprot:tig00021105_g18238.t1